MFILYAGNSFALSTRECRTIIPDLTTDSGRVEWNRCISDPNYRYEVIKPIEDKKIPKKERSIEELTFSEELAERSQAMAIFRKDPVILVEIFKKYLNNIKEIEKCSQEFLGKSKEVKTLTIYNKELTKDQSEELRELILGNGALRGFDGCPTNAVDMTELSAELWENYDPIQAAQFKKEEAERVFRLMAAQNAEAARQKAETARQEKEEATLRINRIKRKLEERLKPYKVALGQPSVFDYSTATGFQFDILNLSKKTIKYVYLTVVGINAVGDVVTDRLQGRVISFRGIGPIESNERASYSKDIMWFTNVVHRARIDSLRVIYMDGASVSVRSPMKIVFSEAELDILALNE